MTDDELQQWIDSAPVVPVFPDHPEPRTMKWSASEIEAIQAYVAACAAHAREMALSEAMRVCLVLVRQVSNENFVARENRQLCATAIEALKGK